MKRCLQAQTSQGSEDPSESAEPAGNWELCFAGGPGRSCVASRCGGFQRVLEKKWTPAKYCFCTAAKGGKHRGRQQRKQPPCRPLPHTGRQTNTHTHTDTALTHRLTSKEGALISLSACYYEFPLLMAQKCVSFLWTMRLHFFVPAH